MSNLRQKTYGVFIKPYISYGGDLLVQQGDLKVQSPCQNSNVSCTQYSNVQGGKAWMLYKSSTSFTIIREIVKGIMDDLGYRKDDIMVTEIIPFDHIVTPLASD